MVDTKHLLETLNYSDQGAGRHLRSRAAYLLANAVWFTSKIGIVDSVEGCSYESCRDNPWLLLVLNNPYVVVINFAD